jgi:hypothetical protein
MSYGQRSIDYYQCATPEAWVIHRSSSEDSIQIGDHDYMQSFGPFKFALTVIALSQVRTLVTVTLQMSALGLGRVTTRSGPLERRRVSPI